MLHAYIYVPPSNMSIKSCQKSRNLNKANLLSFGNTFGHPVTEIIRFTLQMQPLLLADRNIDYSRIVGL